MKLSVKVKLKPTAEQHAALKRTMETANAACNSISEWAHAHRVYHKYALHYALYYDIRKEFPLSAQMVIRCLAKVGGVYKISKRTVHQFRPTGAIAYDHNILSWFIAKGQVSIWADGKRIKVPFACSERQMEMLETRCDEAQLILIDGTFYLVACCDVVERPAIAPTDALGVDLGIANIATDSDGQRFSGKAVKSIRYRCHHLRAKLQSKGTKSAKRLLKKRRRKESRFARDVNHCIAKNLVAKAEGTGRSIALEDLKGIRQRLVVRKAQRRIQHDWAFAQLRAFIEYKARLAGIPVILVDPRNTSRTCTRCGHISKSNRRTQAVFRCVLCGFSGHADVIAAENIRRAAVNQPDAGQRKLLSANH